MEDYEYKCVPMPAHMAVPKEGNVTGTAEAYQVVINEAVYNGWEFVTAIATKTSKQPDGINKFLDSTLYPEESNMLVFKKRKAHNETKMISELNHFKKEILEQLKQTNATLIKLLEKD